jgi:hypothetical protein
MTNTQTISVELFEESVVVYRPVEAAPPDGVLRLRATASADEHG